MRRKRLILCTAIAFNLILGFSDAAVGQSNDPTKHSDKSALIGAVISAGNKAILDEDWIIAEAEFRKAVKLEPKQTLWRIQLFLALGQQKKWKEAFKEFDKIMELGVMNWVLTFSKKLPNGKVAFVNTDAFRDEKNGIERFVRAVREKKNVDSIAEDVGAKLDEFAKQKEIALVYDINSFKDKPFEKGKTVDLTQEFIAYYNQRIKAGR